VGTTALEVRAPSRSAMTILAEARSMFEPAYRASLNRIAPRMRLIAGYHAGWWDETGRATNHVGKAIRPALVLGAAKAVGVDDLRKCLIEAVAVELIHDFSLLHDDLMDGDTQRRHRPTAWTVFGKSAALLAGDSLLALAVHELVARPTMAVLAKALLVLCSGQAADMEFEERSSVGIDECLRMIEAKTASLLSCACEMGGISAGANSVQRHLLSRFGHHLGMSFQLIDDVLGIWGDSEKTGKPIYSDLANRKKSAPIVIALEANPLLQELYSNELNDHRALKQMADLVERTGARAWAEAEAKKHLATAHQCLSEVASGAAALDLRLLAELASNRSR